MADPGFPIGGALTHWGGANLRCVHFLAKMYAKTKEIDPVGGGGACTDSAPPPGSANATNKIFQLDLVVPKYVCPHRLCFNPH